MENPHEAAKEAALGVVVDDTGRYVYIEGKRLMSLLDELYKEIDARQDSPNPERLKEELAILLEEKKRNEASKPRLKKALDYVKKAAPWAAEKILEHQLGL